MASDPIQTTTRRIANARRLLENEGYIVVEPATIRRCDMLDQCEYPDRNGDPGDTCTHSTDKQRMTRYGWMWLCPQHHGAPIKELFDDRLNHVEA